MVMKADQRIRNKHSQPIRELHLSYDRREFAYEISIEGAKIRNDDPRLGYSIYQLDPPMAPGEKRRMTYTVRREPRGISNSTGGLQFVQNGTFFNNFIAPQIGYQADAELSERNDRKKRGLPEKDLMPALVRGCTAQCAHTYLSNHSDWVTIETVISTAPDQIAIAPGSLNRAWNQDGRRYFHYQADHEVLNFYSFLSARYSVLPEDSNGVVCEVCYHADHPRNVPRMMTSMEKSLDHYNRNFGPYGHRRARIIEFPWIASFAQAFPGTTPYSESVSFIAKIQKLDDIDMVYYEVAHEMAHQWRAHQVVGANMRGATLLSEILVQYSALIVMEKEYRRDLMRKFLEYEADRYLSSRGRKLLKERPLRDVEAQQGYIHYRKGSVAMYYLKKMIGEEAVNRALRKLVARYSRASAPDPTAYALIDALREETPADLQYLIRDLFEEITLFANRSIEAKAVKRPDGKFDVTIDGETRKYRADEKGNEQEVPVADYIEIGAFAKPAKDQRYGRTLHRERVRLTTPKARFQFVTAELPDKAGVDPFRLLIDRIPDDNLKKVSGE